MTEQKKLSLTLSEDHPAYQWAKRQSDSVEAFGHIGTHIDCYTRVPATNHYNIDTVVIDCRQSMPSINQINDLCLVNKAVVLYTGNLEINQYGTKEYGEKNTHLDSHILDCFLAKQAAFIMIDSYGIGAHGDQHITFDKRCEQHNCFIIENICLNEDIAYRIENIAITFDIDSKSTGKRCEVIAYLKKANGDS